MRGTSNRGRSVLLGLAIAAGLLAAGPVRAQAVTGQTREEIQRGRLDERLRAPGQPLAVDGAVERAPCPLADPQYAALRFTLREARFAGIEDLPAGMLADAAGDLVGKELPVAAVCEIRDRAATILRRAGYLAAVQVPPQTIEGGTVRFDVILARLAAVQVRGDAGPQERALKPYLDKLAAQRLFNIHEAERYLLLARDIPGLDVRLTLQPAAGMDGARPGDVVGVFNVLRTPFYADVNIQNYGSKGVGRFGGLARLRVNGITGLGDETVVSVFSTLDGGEQQVLQAGHEFRLGGEGLTLSGNLTVAWTRPDLPAGPDLFRSRTTVGTLQASYPFLRSQTANITGTAGIDIIDQTVRFAGAAFSRDRLRVAFLSAQFNTVDRASVQGHGGYSAYEPRLALAGAVELRQGLSAFNASKGCGPGFARCLLPGAVPPSRIDGDPTAFVLRASGQLDFRPVPLFKLAVKARLQYAPHALFSYEEISGGNYTVGRGYDPGAIIGDSGYGLQAEVAYGSLVPRTPGGVALQPFAFIDHMAVSNRLTPGDPQRLTSAGGGLRATLGRQASLEAYGAVPLRRAPLQARRGDARFLVSLTVQLAPWYR